MTINAQKKVLKNSQFKKVEFFCDGNGSIPKYAIAIFPDRTIILHAIENNLISDYKGDVIPYGSDDLGENVRETEIRGIYKSKLTKKIYNQLLNLVYQLDTEFLQRDFSNGQIHSAMGTLKLTSDDNQTRAIYDEGLMGSERLITLYKMLEDVKIKTNWE